MARDRYLYGDGVRAEIEESVAALSDDSDGGDSVLPGGVDGDELSPFARLSVKK